MSASAETPLSAKSTGDKGTSSILTRPLGHPVMDPSMGGMAMQPGAAPGVVAPTFSVHPSFSPLHMPSVQHNALILSNLATLCACFSGALAGVIGLKNLNGFFLYLVASVFNAGIIAAVKCNDPDASGISLTRYIVAAHDPTGAKTPNGGRAALKALWGLAGIGQDTLLTFLLFWIGIYVRALDGWPGPPKLIPLVVCAGRRTWYAQKSPLIYSTRH